MMKRSKTTKGSTVNKYTNTYLESKKKKKYPIPFAAGFIFAVLLSSLFSDSWVNILIIGIIFSTVGTYLGIYVNNPK